MKAEIPRHQFLFWKIRGVHCTVCGKVLIAQESWRAKDVWPLAFSDRSLWSLGGAFVWLRAWYCRSCVGQGELLNYYWIYNLELLREAWPELGKRSTVTQLSENFTQGTKCQLPRGTVLGARQFRAEFWFWHVCQHPHISEHISFPCYPKTSAHWSAWLIKVFFQKGCASSPQILTGCEVCFGKAWELLDSLCRAQQTEIRSLRGRDKVPTPPDPCEEGLACVVCMIRCFIWKK